MTTQELRKEILKIQKSSSAMSTFEGQAEEKTNAIMAKIAEQRGKAGLTDQQLPDELVEKTPIRATLDDRSDTVTLTTPARKKGNR